MRLILKLKANKDMAYTHEYKYKLHGFFWNCIENSQSEEKHDNANSYFTFSNIFPFESTLKEGKKYNIIFSSGYNDIFSEVVKSLLEMNTLNIGNFSFDIIDIQEISVDVGSVGDTGTITAETGIYCQINSEEYNKYNIESSSDSLSWVPNFGIKAFQDKIKQNISHKHDLVCGRFKESPDTSTKLFDSINLKDTYGVKIPVTTDYERTFVVSKFDFNYTIQNPDHRRWLNLSLQTGLGQRNALGFGFTNITRKNGEKL